MELYFIRHGYTVDNEKSVFQNDNAPLSENGINKIKTLKPKIAEINYTRVIASPLLRTRQTAEILTPQQEIIYTDLLKEIRAPQALIGMDRDNKQVLKELEKSRLDKVNSIYHDSESFEELHMRVKKLTKFLLQYKNENLLVITHSILTKMFIYATVFGFELNKQTIITYIPALKIRNGCILHFTYDKTAICQWKWKIE